tara:strand:- start:530 stop:670 length:141 start_codon:yes stop_codon:yes gene_type:complete
MGPIIFTKISFPPMYFNGIAMKNKEMVEMVSRIPDTLKKLKIMPPP